MQIIRQKSDYLVMYAGANLTSDEISNLGNGWCDPRVSVANAEVISEVTLPTGFLPDCWSYNEGVWTVVAGKQSQVDVRIGMPSITVPNFVSVTPGAVLTSDGILESYMDISWNAVATAASYEIRYARTTDSNWSIWTVQDSNSPTNTYRLSGLVAGVDYKLGIRANCLWGLSEWSSDYLATSVIPGELPANVSNFTGSFDHNLSKVSWDLLDSKSLHTYEIRQGSVWSTATVLRTGEQSGAWSFRPSSSGSITYLIKARDKVGNYSATAASVVVAIPLASPPTGILTTPVLFGINIFITYPNNPDIDYCEIYESLDNNRDHAYLKGITRNGSFPIEGLGIVAARYYWARTVNFVPESSTWYPSSSTAGVLGYTLSDPTKVIKLLNDEVTDDSAAAYLSGHTSLINILDTRNMVFELGVVGPGVAATYTQAISQASSEINRNHTLLQTLNSMVAGLLAPPAYDPVTPYVVGNLVTGSDELIYQNKLACTGVAPPNATYWKPISDFATLINEIQQNLDTATATWTSTASSLSADIAALNDPTTGRVTIAETNIAQNADLIALTGQSIMGPLVFAAGVVGSGVQAESISDFKAMAVQVSTTHINMDSAKSNIALAASRIDTAEQRISQAEIDIDAANAEISLRASISSLDSLTGVVSAKAAQIDLDAANARINLRVTSDNLSAQVDIINDAIGLKLNASGTVGPGMHIGYTDGTHTRSNITMLTDTFLMAKPDGTGVRNVFDVGDIGGVSTVGVNGNMVIDGTLTADKIAADQLFIGSNVFMAPGATLSWSDISKIGASLSDVDSTASTKLGSIAANATVGATWGTNVSSIPSNIAGAGSAGTAILNSDIALQNQITTAASTAEWVGVGGTGKPADDATVGAVAGTNLKDSGGAVLGDSAIKNASITIGSDGKIAGIGTADVVVDNSKLALTDLGGMPISPSTPTNIGANWIYTGALTAGQVNAVDINAGSITVGDLQSSDYVTGTSGWKLGLDGSAEFMTADIVNTANIAGNAVTIQTFFYLNSALPAGTGVRTLHRESVTVDAYMIGRPIVLTISVEINSTLPNNFGLSFDTTTSTCGSSDGLASAGLCYFNTPDWDQPANAQRYSKYIITQVHIKPTNVGTAVFIIKCDMPTGTYIALDKRVSVFCAKR